MIQVTLSELAQYAALLAVGYFAASWSARIHRGGR